MTRDLLKMRDFDLDSHDPRMVIAVALSRRSGFTQIPSGIWADAGALVAAFKTAGLLRSQRERREAAR